MSEEQSDIYAYVVRDFETKGGELAADRGGVGVVQ
jgi:hypothetical protein